MINSTVACADVGNVVLAIHGGLAGPRENLSEEYVRDIRAALEEALMAGFKKLQSDPMGSVKAVVAAVCVMEDSPHFNAGKGSVFTQAGTIEMDASIMEGKHRRAGAVAAVKRIQNPVLAAKAVMNQSRAVLLVGEAADEFAHGAGLQIVAPEYFFTERRRNDFQARKESQGMSPAEASGAVADQSSKGTVGAVALDREGNLAAATSTGGVTFKPPGRVGDSAIIGAGTFADNRTCAVSATGDGEVFIRSCAAYSVSARMMYRNQNVAEAAQEAVDDIRSLGGEGGLIVIDRHGNVTTPFHALGMYRGSINERGDVNVALYHT